MNVRVATTVACLVSGMGLWLSAAQGQERQAALKWQYKAVDLGGNEKEATKRLNALAAEGWQYVGPLGHNLVAFKRIEPSAEVSGTVTLDGKPIASGMI